MKAFLFTSHEALHANLEIGEEIIMFMCSSAPLTGNNSELLLARGFLVTLQLYRV